MSEKVNGKTLGPVLEFMRTLWALDHALQSASKRMESRLEITAPQRLVVRIVGRYPGVSAGEVSEILHLHPSTLTGILRRLGDRGLVERRPDPRDARRALLFLSSKGRAVDELRSGTVEAAVRRALTRVRPAAVQHAREVAEAVASELARLD
ncbi:MarR family winged helix-turn-helix transcriptional regulator [Anaeromyxobacter sp. Fw109-5]|uniref:MarR family winged helix-turn-helix transcriptional regulator n=1 Tax=Anaeromyxobacter sp. (strain Fw109-5) TaxID=404589 RepID=UPI001F3C2605|nr:MarR family transcriptional regulator [Anaeromyxobacter sp. Fw109-5]